MHVMYLSYPNCYKLIRGQVLNLQLKHQDEDPYFVGILDDVVGTTLHQRHKHCSPIASGNNVGKLMHMKMSIFVNMCLSPAPYSWGAPIYVLAGFVLPLLVCIYT